MLGIYNFSLRVSQLKIVEINLILKEILVHETTNSVRIFYPLGVRFIYNIQKFKINEANFKSMVHTILHKLNLSLIV